MATENTGLLNSSVTAGVDAIDDPYDDAPKDMTWERRIARYLSKFNFYYPHRQARAEYEKTLAETDEEKTKMDEDKVVPPSLDLAWSYFEHIVLPRHLLVDKSAEEKTVKDKLQRAEPGRRDVPTRLYSVWSTPESELADFGIGVGIYFYMLRILAIICLIAGLINIPSYEYFASDNFTFDDQKGLSIFLKGSATCTASSWETCPNCTKEQWLSYPSTLESFATTRANDGSEPLTFIKKNNCEIGNSDAISTWICFIFVCIAIGFMGRWSRKKEVVLDEAEQSASDYSIAVDNPPKDARDPDEWKRFFEENFEGCQVACCTIALDNEELIRALGERRDYLLQLEMLMPENVVFDKDELQRMSEVALPLPLYMRLQGYYDAKGLYKSIVELDKKIDKLSYYSHECSDVFVSFETEQAQRAVLEAFSISGFNLATKNKKALPSNLLFRGKHILNVVEPAEPNSIRWQDLDETFMQKKFQQFITFILTTITIVGGSYLIFLARDQSPFLAAVVISFLGSVVPYIIYYINDVETHRNEGSKAASIFTKMALVRWIYAAIVTSMVTPFVYTLEQGENYLIYQVYYIFITEFLTPLITQMTDTGTFYRHVFGPRECTQKRMNMCFQGTEYELSERYTDMTKILFLAVFYAVVYPAGFFFASAIFVAKYWFDKYCLLRTWSPAPHMGSQIAEFTRTYFFPLALAIYAINAAYTYASFPYDNACQSSTQVSEEYVGTHVAYTYDDFEDKDVEIDISISPNKNNYFYCYQNMMWFVPLRFPPLPEWQPEGQEWMTEEQEKDVYLFGITSLVATILVALIFLQNLVLSPLVSCFTKTYKPSGEASTDRFSDVRVMLGYIPQIKVVGYNFPLLACDVDSINDKALIGWEDPDNSYDIHSLVYDIPRIAKKKGKKDDAENDKEEEPTVVTERKLFLGEEEENPFMFSIVKDWRNAAPQG